MKTPKLGRSGLTVSAVGLGYNRLQGVCRKKKGGFWPPRLRSDVRSTLAPVFRRLWRVRVAGLV